MNSVKAVQSNARKPMNINQRVRVVKPPHPLPTQAERLDFKTLFLAGSIEMGKAIDWQQQVADRYYGQENLMILNPRRDNWDSSWAQDPTPGTKFHQQVKWELDALEMSNYILFNFVPDTISPVSLLELGLFAGLADRVTLVACPPAYFRYGNVKMVCSRYHVPHFESLDLALQWLDTEL